MADVAQHGESGGAGVGSASELSGALEAVLLASDKPLTHVRLAEALGVDGASAHDVVGSLVAELNETYGATGRSFRVERVSGGYRVMTLPEFAWAVAAIRGMQPSSKLSRASIETLSIVAYKQPMTRAEVDAIRGVSSGEVLKGLLDRRLIAITGRADTLGRPMLYGTTDRFLEAFGLASIRDLPPVEDGFEAVLASRSVGNVSDAGDDDAGVGGMDDGGGRLAGVDGGGDEGEVDDV